VSTLLVSLWAVTAAAFTAVALVRLARRRPAPPGARPARGVVLLRPVDAAAPGELENLGTRLEGVEQIVVSPRPLGPGRHLASDPPAHNRKLGHLKAALRQLPEARGRAVLVADADVAVDGALVDALLAAIDAGAALAWAAPHPTTRGFSRGLLVQSLHSFEVLGVMSPGAATVCGKAMALSPAAAEALLALPDCIGEDLELSRALDRRGLKVVPAGRALMPLGDRGVLARFTRWMQVLKAHRPALFPAVPLLFACTPVLLVLGALTGAGAAVAALVALRLVAAAALERRVALHVEWLLAEGLLLACWLGALARGRRVRWRGRDLKLGEHGALE